MDLIQFFGRFHVLVLHLPIGILMLAACIEIYTLAKNTTRQNILNWVWFWGVISAIVACVLGWMLSQGGGYQAEAIFIHRSFGLSVVAISIVCWLYFKSLKLNFKMLGYFLATSQLFLLFSTGHYGANMTHGETYLIEKAPDFVRTSIGFPAHSLPRPPITSLDDADIYLDVIEPMLKSRCTSCHNDHKQKGKLNLASVEGMMKGGRSGDTVVINDAKHSELYKRITLANSEKKFMPAEGKTALNDSQVAIIKWWINNGAKTQGNVSTIASNKKETAQLNELLGLYEQTSLAALPNIPDISNAQAAELESLGFVVKNITQNSGYLDLDLSVSKQALTADSINKLSPIANNIIWLNLADTNITSALIQSISNYPNLMKLRLDGNNLSTDDLTPLTKLTKLSYLNLYSNNIDDSVFKLFKQFNALKHVYLTDTQVTQAAVQAFIKESDIKVSFFEPPVTIGTKTENSK